VTIGDLTRHIYCECYNTHSRNTQSNNRVITPRVPQIWRAAAWKWKWCNKSQCKLRLELV